MPDIFSLLKTLGNEDITRYSDSEVLTPQNIVSDMVDLLPQEVFNPHTTFLDPAVKSGRFLKEIYNRLFNSSSLKAAFPDEQLRRDHILHNQLYGLATSTLSATLSRALLYDTAIYRGNIVYSDNYIARVSSSKGKDIKKIAKGVFDIMQFDIVIGNPPYQDGSQSIYPYFIEAGLDIAPRVCMITQNNYFVSDTLAGIRKKMVLSGLKEIINYPKFFEIFDGVQTTVAIFRTDAEWKGETSFKEIVDGKITNSYSAKLNENALFFSSSTVYGIIKKLGLDSTDNFSKYIRSSSTFGVATNGVILASYRDIPVKINDKPKQDDTYNTAVVYSNGMEGMSIRYCKREDVPANIELIDNYKVICTSAMKDSKQTITNIRLIPRNSITTSSFVTLYENADPQKVYHAGQYIKSRFFRFLANCSCPRTGGAKRVTTAPNRFILIPDQDFTDQSDIQWEKDLSDIDKQLYSKYNLSKEEIDYIEKTVEPCRYQ